jgi:undecaprenyl-diphosphatase
LVILLAWDPALFRAIHLGLHHPALDPIMMALTDPGRWKIPLLILVGALFLTRRARGALALIVLALTLTVGDQVSAKVIKPLVKRPRPSVVLADSHPLFGVRRTYSFPSVHAVNFSAAVPIVATVFPAATIPAAVVAALVCFSRIYVGDHWPSDVLAGILLGLGLGLLGRKAFLRLEQNAQRWVSRPGAGESPSAGP